MISLSGVTGGIRPGARITVYMRDLTQKKSRFIKQKKMAVVSSDGTISWRGNAPSNRMAVYVAGEGVRSKIITVTGRK